jgi:hypothetical protein
MMSQQTNVQVPTVGKQMRLCGMRCFKGRACSSWPQHEVPGATGKLQLLVLTYPYSTFPVPSQCERRNMNIEMNTSYMPRVERLSKSMN